MRICKWLHLQVIWINSLILTEYANMQMGSFAGRALRPDWLCLVRALLMRADKCVLFCWPSPRIIHTLLFVRKRDSRRCICFMGYFYLFIFGCCDRKWHPDNVIPLETKTKSEIIAFLVNVNRLCCVRTFCCCCFLFVTCRPSASWDCQMVVLHGLARSISERIE